MQKKALKTKNGDCTEYAELMIALCRAKGIPARIVNGMVVVNATNPRHNWVEIYLKQYGWIGFDPTHGDSPKSLTSFENLENKYIYRSYSRKDLSGWYYLTKTTKGVIKDKTYFEFQDVGNIFLKEAIVFYNNKKIFGSQ